MVTGRLSRVKGRTAVVALNQQVPSAAKLTMFTLGKEDPTNLEAQRTDVVLGVLQGRYTFFSSHFAGVFFLGHTLRKARSPPVAECSDSGPRLNLSQRQAKGRILSNDPRDRICVKIVHIFDP